MNFKNNILFISHSSDMYGAPRSLYLLVKHLDRERFRPTVVLPEEGPLKRQLGRIVVPTAISPLEGWHNTGNSAAGFLRWTAGLPHRVNHLVELIQSHDIELVHTNVPFILEGAFAASLTGRPHLCTIRGDLAAHKWIKGCLTVPQGYAALSALSTMIVPVSTRIKDVVTPHVDPAKLRIIFNGIEPQPERLAASQGDGDAGLQLASVKRAPNVCSVGRVTHEKGFDLLIDAAALVAKAYSTARFSIFGPINNKNLYKDLLLQTGRLHLTGNIRFEGHTDQVLQNIQASDLVVLTSLTEGFPRVVLEAMAAGKPVVSTRCGGSEDAIVDGETGYLVPLGDPKALAEAIVKVLDDPHRAREMGRKGQERVRKHFDIRHITRKYEALYHEVLRNNDSICERNDKPNDVIMKVLLEIFEKYGDDLHEMGNRFEGLKRFESKVKQTFAYKTYKTTKNLKERFLKNPT